MDFKTYLAHLSSRSLLTLHMVSPLTLKKAGGFVMIFTATQSRETHTARKKTGQKLQQPGGGVEETEKLLGAPGIATRSKDATNGTPGLY